MSSPSYNARQRAVADAAQGGLQPPRCLPSVLHFVGKIVFATPEVLIRFLRHDVFVIIIDMLAVLHEENSSIMSVVECSLKGQWGAGGHVTLAKNWQGYILARSQLSWLMSCQRASYHFRSSW